MFLVTEYAALNPPVNSKTQGLFKVFECFFKYFSRQIVLEDIIAQLKSYGKKIISTNPKNRPLQQEKQRMEGSI